MTDASDDKRDFFVSYNGADRAWAEWVAWQLEATGYTVYIEAWDFRPGHNFVLEMDRAAKLAERTVPVLSPNFLASRFTRPEWAAAFADDPTGEKGLVVPVRVAECDPKGLLGPIDYIDLVGQEEAQAQDVLLRGVQRGRAKPLVSPGFPGAPARQVAEKPRFPGKSITFLSNSHEDARWMEALARRLEDECGFQVGLDKWVLGLEKGRHQAMACGLEQVPSWVVFIGAKTSREWLQEKIEHALDLQARNSNFRIIPVLLPGSDPNVITEFPSLRTWADFRDAQDQDYAFHVLRQGIRGEPVGRWPQRGDTTSSSGKFKICEQKITELYHFRSLGVHEETIIEFERKILDKWLDDGEFF